MLLTPASFSINHLQRLGCSVHVENRVNAAFSAKCLVYNVHCTVLRVKCAVHIVQCLVYGENCADCSVKFTATRYSGMQTLFYVQGSKDHITCNFKLMLFFLLWYTVQCELNLARENIIRYTVYLVT